VSDFYRDALESIAEGVLILDLQGCVLYANSSAEDILEIDLNGTTGCFCGEVLSGGIKSEFTQTILDSVFRSSLNPTRRIVDFKAENIYKTLSLTTSFLENSENLKSDPAGVICVFRDITKSSVSRNNHFEAFERVKNINLELEARNQILQDLTSTVELDEVLIRILETSKKLIDAQGLSLLRLDESAGQLYFAAVDNETFSREKLIGKAIPAEKGIAGWVAQNKKAIIVNCPQQDNRFNESVDKCTGFTTESVLAVPVTFEGRLLAVMQAVNKKHSSVGFSEIDLRPMKQLASCAAIAIRNAELFRELRQISITDHLTGLANSRHFFHVFKKTLSDAEKKREKFSVIMMDMDNFKEVVDTYGHQVGSKTLVEISKIIRRHVPEDDIVCRFGGDEFVILLARMHETGAVRVADRIRHEIHCLETLFDGKVDVRRMTCSVGISIYPEHGSSTDELFQLADQAMYRIKNGGKNGIHVWEDYGR